MEVDSTSRRSRIVAAVRAVIRRPWMLALAILVIVVFSYSTQRSAETASSSRDHARSRVDRCTHASRIPDVIVPFSSHDQWQDWAGVHKALLSPASVSSVVDTALECGVRSPTLGDVPPSGMSLYQGSTNYRESLIAAGFNSRQRALLDMLMAEPGIAAAGDVTAPSSSARIFAHEAVTPFALWMRGRFPRFLGSEYAKDPAAEAALYPIPAIDIQASGLRDGAFDAVVSQEVLEHVPDLRAALADTARILRKGGAFIATFPVGGTHTVAKARLGPGGKVEHLSEPPEYHGNPVDPAGGSLVFQIPGWDVLQMAKEVGFATAEFVFVSSHARGITGAHIPGVLLFRARK